MQCRNRVRMGLRGRCCCRASLRDTDDTIALLSRFAGLVNEPACSILASRRVRAGAAVLADLAEEGRLEAFVKQLIDLIRTGQIPWDSRRKGKWVDFQQVGILDPRSAAALADLARLVTIRTNEGEDCCIVEGGRGLLGEVRVLHTGSPACLRCVDRGDSWGPLARMTVSDGPAELCGMHVVSWKRYARDGAQVFRSRAELLALGDSAYDVQDGDVLHLADAERAAFLEVACFDRMPLSAALLRQQDLLDLDIPLVELSRELQEARAFEEAQRGAPVAEVRRARLARLATFPIVRQVLSMARQDDPWSRILPVLSSVADAAYEAAESQSGYWAAPTRMDADVDGSQVLLLVAVACLGLLLIAAA
eukprot:CAMPEP_0177560150 /NCGR_PEP_ID=MMETSP0369-20130122/71223_1 /TAXON_ID=447022 ORGANISM="Scrippsiella hangoei-like, Strain SHHI-4" /NCGR_SAMPLE_ID=MMETSP0369 /ASSEMBLY_ACC=CAM_ASM_000364 /LENGTH=363 /DNA_ID=CAMNT_0019046941 /DNA_START=83 /DNA_END=1170 /DNA_ORIENTATION=+